MIPAARAAAYLATLPAAVSGQDGHGATYAVACMLVKFGLSERDAWPLLLAYNERCLPKWAEADLRHKLDDAFKATCSDPKFADKSRKVSTPPPAQPAREVSLPFMHAGSLSIVEELAELRGLGVDGLLAARQDGLLAFGMWKNQRAWFVVDPGAPWPVAQARRMDGERWEVKTKRDGEDDPKSLTICTKGLGHAKWSVGASRIGNKPCVALVEGGPDLLAAYHFCFIEGVLDVCQPVAMLGAQMRPINPNALPLFDGKRVRIFPDADAVGQASGEAWADNLVKAGATVDWFDYTGYTTASILNDSVHDLNDLAHMSAETFDANPELQAVMPHEEGK